MKFNGSSAFIKEYEAHNQFNNYFSYSVLFMIDDFQDNKHCIVNGRNNKTDDDSSDKRYNGLVMVNDGTITLYSKTDTSDATSLTSDTVVSEGIWYHLTYRADGNNDKHQVFLNGELLLSIDTDGGNATLGDDNIFTGVHHYNNGDGDTYDNYLNGKISNFKIYDRVLSDEDIKTIYEFDKNYIPYPIQEGLVAFYPLNYNSLDSSTNQYDGTDNGDVNYDGLCASFEGDGDYIDLDFDDIPKDSLTISFWLFSKDNTEDEKKGIFTYRCNDNAYYGFKIFSEDNKLKIRFFDDIGGTIWEYISEDIIEFYKWYHIVFVYNGSTKYVYIDNEVYIDNDDNDILYDDDANEIHIARYANRFDNDRDIKAKISKFRIYDRPLSPKEIELIYKVEKGEFIE